MPFGGKCEYATFGSCVSAIKRTRKWRDERARAYCGALMRRTEEHCRRQRRREAQGEAVNAADVESELDEIIAEIEAAYGD
jgi:hypothetical protein